MKVNFKNSLITENKGLITDVKHCIIKAKVVKLL